jgi:trans-aconitate 2-methyltransferase
MNHTNPAYLFGDTELAAERLRRLADVFAPASREFLELLRPRRPKRIADLGCGPGYTTRLLADVFPDATVRGLDSSQSFVILARRAPHERIAFEVADVTRSLPGGPYDLVYCRYLLTHVPNYHDAIALWSRHLAAGGMIAIEENEWIRTREPVLEKYLSIVEAMLADGGQKLYVGAQLDRAASWPALVKRRSDVVGIDVSNRATARMFLPNLATWREKPFVAEHFTVAELDRLQADLEQLAEDQTDRKSITFGRRGLVLARVDS